MQWIAHVLSRAGLLGKEMGPACVMRLVQGGVSMELLEYDLPCGHSGYRVDLEFRVPESDEWMPIASLRDFNLDESIALLQQAQKCIASRQM
jgi:hypothetical protein